jgi:hypothetical protein
VCPSWQILSKASSVYKNRSVAVSSEFVRFEVFTAVIMKNAILLDIKNLVRTSPETHYISATEPNLLMLCKIWGFHGGDYEEWSLLECDAVWLLSKLQLLVTANVPSSLILITGAASSSQTSFLTRSARSHITEDSIPPFLWSVHITDITCHPTSRITERCSDVHRNQLAVTCRFTVVQEAWWTVCKGLTGRQYSDNGGPFPGSWDVSISTTFQAVG